MFGSDFDSFDASELDGFIESELNARGFESAITATELLAVFSVLGIEKKGQIRYFSAPGNLENPLAIGETEQFDPHFVHFTAANLDFAESETYEQAGLDVYNGYALVAKIHAATHTTYAVIDLLTGFEMWTFSVSYVGVEPTVSRAVISGNHVAWITVLHVTSGPDNNDQILYLNLRDLADGGDETAIEIDRADYDESESLAVDCQALRARIVIEDIGGVLTPVRRGYVVAYIIDEGMSVGTEIAYLSLLNAGGAITKSISRVDNTFVKVNDCMVVSETGAVYCVEDVEVVSTHTWANGLVAYTENLSRDTSLDFVFASGYRPGTIELASPGFGLGRCLFTVFRDLCFSTYSTTTAFSNPNSITAFDRAGTITGSLRIPHGHVQWLLAEQPEGATEDGATDFTGFATTDTYDATNLPYERDLLPPGAGAGYFAHKYIMTQISGPNAAVTLIDGDYHSSSDVKVKWEATLSAPIITAIPNEVATEGAAWGILVTIDAISLTGADSDPTIDWSIRLQGINDIRTGNAGALATWDSRETGLAWSWSLDVAPSGMSIIPFAEVAFITWSSVTLGVHNVTVRVSHAGGADTRSFTLTVT